MSDNYNALDTTHVKVTRVDTVVDAEQEVVAEVEAVVVEQEQEQEQEQVTVVAPALVVQRPVLYFLERLVRPF